MEEIEQFVAARVEREVRLERLGREERREQRVREILVREESLVITSGTEAIGL